MPADVRIDAEVELDEARLTAMAEAVLQATETADAELSVLLTTDAHIAQLNAIYLNKEGATDVLSFPQEAALPVGPRQLGDVVIAVGRASEQAAEHGHDLITEIWVLLIHGVLHLLGHDHGNEPDRQAMAQVEAKVLAAVGQVDGTGLVGRSDQG
ncbi:MAG: rRNA maturation RNase YbeY [Myxococcota bacterium]